MDSQEARIAQLGKSVELQLWIVGSRLTADGAFYWYGPLSSPSLHVASVGSDHHGAKWTVQPVNKGQDHSTVVRDPLLPS